MNLTQYQQRAVSTVIYSDADKVVYPLLGLVNEAGEVAGKFKKYLRDTDFESDTSEAWSACKAQMADEVGDCLWYIANLAADLGFTLDQIAEVNLAKLQSRKDRGALKGSGDDR